MEDKKADETKPDELKPPEGFQTDGYKYLGPVYVAPQQQPNIKLSLVDTHNFSKDKEEQKKSSAHSTQPSEGGEQMEQIDSKVPTDPQAANMTKGEQMVQVILALQAKKLAKEDGEPCKVFDDLFIGSIGCAYNKEKLQEAGITHILCCAAKIKPKYPDDFKYE